MSVPQEFETQSLTCSRQPASWRTHVQPGTGPALRAMGRATSWVKKVPCAPDRLQQSLQVSLWFCSWLTRSANLMEREVQATQPDCGPPCAPTGTPPPSRESLNPQSLLPPHFKKCQISLKSLPWTPGPWIRGSLPGKNTGKSSQSCLTAVGTSPSQSPKPVVATSHGERESAAVTTLGILRWEDYAA